MDDLRIADLLDADPRPAFIVDLHASSSADNLHVCFRSKSSQDHGTIIDLIVADTPQFKDLREWIFSNAHDAASLQWRQQGMDFISFVLGDRWKVVQSMVLPQISQIFAPSLDRIGMAPVAYQTGVESMSFESVLSIFGFKVDATLSIPGLTELLGQIAQVDWGKTAIGSLYSWPVDVLQIIHLMLMASEPQFLYLGPDNQFIYNVAYTKILGARHPAILGKSLTQAWPEVAELTLAVLSEIDKTGSPYYDEDFSVSLDRHGRLEEAFFTWTTSPLNGSLGGYFTSTTEVTYQKISKRHRSTLTALSDAYTVKMRDLSVLWQKSLEALLPNGKDFPLGFIYSVHETLGSSLLARNHSALQGSECRLEGALGFSNVEAPLPVKFDLASSNECFAEAFREAITLGKPVRLSATARSIPEELARQSEKRGFGDVCREAMVLPICGRSTTTFALLVVGLNTRKRYDEGYSEWLENLVRVINNNVAMTVASQEEYDVMQQAATERADEEKAMQEALASETVETQKANLALQRTLRMMEMVDVGMFEYDLAGNLIGANDAFHELSGYPRVPVPAFSFVDLLFDEDKEDIMEKWGELMRGTSLTFELRWRGSSPADTGSTNEGTWVLAACLPQYDDHGSLVSISGCLTRIDAQKQKEKTANLKRSEALEQATASEQRFFRFAEIVPVAIFILDPVGQLQYVNEEWFKMTGHPKVPFSEISWPNVVLAEDLPRVSEFVADVMKGLPRAEVEYRVRNTRIDEHGNQEWIWGCANLRVERNEDGSIRSMMGAIADISHFKLAERLLQSRVDEAVEAQRQTENFIDMTSHEIRNPLGAVYHCADAILASLTDMHPFFQNKMKSLVRSDQDRVTEFFESSVDAVNTILSCSAHQRRMIDDILTLSKLDSKLLKISPSLSKPDSVLDDVFSMFAVDAQKVDVQLRVVRDESLKIFGNKWVLADSGRLIQVLINLITNAIKFTQQEDNERVVTLSMGASARRPTEDQFGVKFAHTSTMQQHHEDVAQNDVVYLCFSVQDTGCGLKKDEQARLFARFSQGSPKTYTKYGGSGLGLFISRELTELQGGEIGVGSEAGFGSTFAFYVQARLQDAPMPTEPNGLASTSSAPTCTTEERESTKFSILVVEDNLINQKVLSQQLKKLGHEVHVASHGGEALDFLRTTSHWRGQQSTIALSVILMDWEMPHMNGLQCAYKIREAERTGELVGHVPIIAVSANARSEQVKQALESGMDDAISKPFRIMDLMPKIERLAV